jgi:Peptidase family M28
MHPSSLSWFLLALPLAAQTSPITEARVRETVSWLAADERAGRDTGSAELVAAGEWISARFAAAGLQPLQEGNWYHEFPLPGFQLDVREARLELVRKVGTETKKIELVPDQDFRQWKVAEALTGADDACTVAMLDDPVLQQLLTAGSARRSIVIEVAEDHPYWLRAAAAHKVLGSRRQASRPVFLVRRGVLPPPPGDGREAIWTASWTLPAPEKVEVPQFNVVAMLPGAAKKDEYVVVSAHYDHVGTGREVDGDRIYNGADDNATGTTAVLLIAEAMAKQPPPARSVLFVCFTGEERGLVGSAAFCNRPPVPLAQVVANINIEMIGRPAVGNEGKTWITGVELSDFGAIAGPALQRAGVELVDFAMSKQLFAASDNYSFVKKGVVAHSFSAGSLHADYHQPGDEVDQLDLVHMTKIVQGLHEVVREFADREARPAWNEAGRARLDKLKR